MGSDNRGIPVKKIILVLLVLLPAKSFSMCDDLKARDKKIFTASTLEQALNLLDDWSKNQIMQQVAETGNRLALVKCREDSYKNEKARVDSATVTLNAGIAASADSNNKKILQSTVDEMIGNLDKLKFAWKVEAEELCKKHEDININISMTEKEFNQAKAENRKLRTEALKKCLNYIKDGLEKDKQYSEANKLSTEYQSTELSQLNTYIVDNEAQLKAAEIDFKVQKLDASAEEIHAHFKEKEELADVFTTDEWYPVFFVGMKLSPEYDENGNNKGFTESNVFGRFVVDTRWEYESLFGAETFLWWFKSRPVVHPGVTVDFYSAPIENCENYTEDDLKSACLDRRSSQKDLANGVKFNDISQTLNASLYTWVHLYRSPSNQIEVGPGVRVGMQSRDKLKDDGDSINSYQSFGMRLVFNDFKHPKYSEKKYLNGMPRIEVEGSYFWMEDFAGTGQKAHRKWVSGRFRVLEDSPTYIGLVVNGGKGPDEISLTVSYGLAVESILGAL